MPNSSIYGGTALAAFHGGGCMDIRYMAIGPERPMGDREGADDRWTPKRVEEVSKEEVKAPENHNDIDEDAPDDPSKD
jgi:hypothetical protein